MSERTLVALVIDNQLKQEEGNIDDQNDDAGRIGSRHGRESDLSAPQIDCTRPELSFAVGTACDRLVLIKARQFGHIRRFSTAPL